MFSLAFVIGLGGWLLWFMLFVCGFVYVFAVVSFDIVFFCWVGVYLCVQSLVFGRFSYLG